MTIIIISIFIPVDQFVSPPRAVDRPFRCCIGDIFKGTTRCVCPTKSKGRQVVVIRLMLIVKVMLLYTRVVGSTLYYVVLVVCVILIPSS